MAKPSSPLLRRALPWLVALGAAQLTLRVAGRLWAGRVDAGDASSAELRRAQTLGPVVLRPTSRALTRLRFDLAFAGLDLDLTGARPGPQGVDLVVNCAFAGANVRVPRDWRVAADFRGVGGLDTKRLEPDRLVDDPDTADLRIRLRALLGGGAVAVAGG